MNLSIFFDTEQTFPTEMLKKTFSACKLELKKIPEHTANVHNKKLTINCILTTNANIQPLNKEWRKKDKATDVLSFPYEESESGIFGEIFISLEQAQVQADYLEHSLEKEVEVLFTHGILHIFGYDHEQENDFFVMNALEKKIEKRLEDKKISEHKKRTIGLN